MQHACFTVELLLCSTAMHLHICFPSNRKVFAVRLVSPALLENGGHNVVGLHSYKMAQRKARVQSSQEASTRGALSHTSEVKYFGFKGG